MACTLNSARSVYNFYKFVSYLFPSLVTVIGLQIFMIKISKSEKKCNETTLDNLFKQTTNIAKQKVIRPFNRSKVYKVFKYKNANNSHNSVKRQTYLFTELQETIEKNTHQRIRKEAHEAFATGKCNFVTDFFRKLLPQNESGGLPISYSMAPACSPLE